MSALQHQHENKIALPHLTLNSGNYRSNHALESKDLSNQSANESEIPCFMHRLKPRGCRPTPRYADASLTPMGHPLNPQKGLHSSCPPGKRRRLLAATKHTEPTPQHKILKQTLISN
jgi:hypothetical protein